jgi:hypothetical protein
MDEKARVYYYNYMKIFDALSSVFTKQASATHAEEVNLRRFLRNNGYWSFDEEGISYLLKVISGMGLPVPDGKTAMPGTEGPIIFMDDHGVVLRIEAKQSMFSYRRINHPSILQPIASREIGENYILEICPGCHGSKDQTLSAKLAQELRADGIYYGDQQTGNNGYLPLKTPEFPKGVPVVIDRLAVEWLNKEVEPVRKALANDPQQKLYADLRQAFADAWPEGSALPDTDKMKEFWQLCRQAKDEGRLVSGWVLPEGEEPKFASIDKTHMAAKKGAAYTQLTRGRGL